MVYAKNIHEAILRYGHDEDFEPIADSQFLPTGAPAGSQEKICILEKRVELGQPLWHQDDRVDCEGLYGFLPVSDRVQAPGPGSQNDTVTGKVSLLLSDFELFLPETEWRQACWEQAKRDFRSISLAGVEAPGSDSLFETPKCKLKSTGPSISPPKKNAKPSKLHEEKPKEREPLSKEQPRGRPSAATLRDEPQENPTIFVDSPTTPSSSSHLVGDPSGAGEYWHKTPAKRPAVTNQEESSKYLTQGGGTKKIEAVSVAVTSTAIIESSMNEENTFGELQLPPARKVTNEMEQPVETSDALGTEVLSTSHEPQAGVLKREELGYTASIAVAASTKGQSGPFAAQAVAVVSTFKRIQEKEPIATKTLRESRSASRDERIQNSSPTLKKQESRPSWQRREPTGSRAEALRILDEVRQNGPSSGQAQQANTAVPLRKPTSAEISRFCLFSQAQTEGTVSGNPTQIYLNDLKEKGVDCSLLERCHNGDFGQSKLQELLKSADDR